MNRLRRTMLFVPGGNEKILVKALSLSVDSLILDLEDSVLPENKESSRQAVKEMVNSGDFGSKERIVRVNSLSSEYGGEDISALVHTRVDTFLLPKVNRPKDVQECDAFLTQLEKTEGLLPGKIGIMALIESPLAIVNIDAIAMASSRLN